MSGEDGEDWRRAIVSEVKSILKHNTWILVDRPADKEIIGSRFVLRNKYNSEGTLERRKARLVAKGFAQRPGFHFNETFAPVARMSSVRLLTALAAQEGMNIQHLDVTTAYLNGDIDEELFMEPPKFLKEALESVAENEVSRR
ncbi:uncharacterized mitochondrial protein AtMg00820-like [Solenopsis invicta]|uniref:uncharacterized mitochondrial protein AtMg00820-like n=1 Tax=Solenopsis invicta TaxID=13686 RepID=UPI000E33FC9F|nr:uncharacterized mitochondrial protein AtMg00820-like [Solenopsis invicta]